MKKLLILAATLVTGGLALPASAQQCRPHNSHTEVYISGYLPCGSPIYKRRPVVHHHKHGYREQQARIQREYEYRRRMEIQRQIEYRRMLERQRYYSSQRRHHSYHPPRCR